MKILQQCLAVGAAGFLGAIARMLVASACVRFVPSGKFPLATLIVNLTGTFLLGWFAAATASRLIVSDTLRTP